MVLEHQDLVNICALTSIETFWTCFDVGERLSRKHGVKCVPEKSTLFPVVNLPTTLKPVPPPPLPPRFSLQLCSFIGVSLLLPRLQQHLNNFQTDFQQQQQQQLDSPQFETQMSLDSSLTMAFDASVGGGNGSGNGSGGGSRGGATATL